MLYRYPKLCVLVCADPKTDRKGVWVPYKNVGRVRPAIWARCYELQINNMLFCRNYATWTTLCHIMFVVQEIDKCWQIFAEKLRLVWLVLRSFMKDIFFLTVRLKKMSFTRFMCVNMIFL